MVILVKQKESMLIHEVEKRTLYKNARFYSKQVYVFEVPREKEYIYIALGSMTDYKVYHDFIIMNASGNPASPNIAENSGFNETFCITNIAKSAQE